MTNFEIVILVWVGILTLQVIQNMNRIEKIGWGMTRKMDKPPEETAGERFDRERKNRPLLTKEELDKVMTPEEKRVNKKLYGSEYPITKD